MSKSNWKKLIEETIKRDKGESMGKHTVYGNQVEIFDLKSRVDHLEKMISGLKKANEIEKGYHSFNESKSIGYDEPETNINEWLDLDIKDIPRDWVTSDKLLIEVSQGDGWEGAQAEINKDYRIKALQELFDKKTARDDSDNLIDIKYRYRLKPLESIRITKDLWEDMCSNSLTTPKEERAMVWGNRKVEII